MVLGANILFCNVIYSLLWFQYVLGNGIQAHQSSQIDYANPNQEKTSFESGLLDYYAPLDIESFERDTENILPEYYFNNLLAIQKRPNIKLIPRIGRRKRSTSSNGNQNVNESYTKTNQAVQNNADSDFIWKDLEEKRAYFIPRIGRSYTLSSFGRSVPRLSYKSRGTFIPRIGRRKRSISQDYNRETHDRSLADYQNTPSADDFMWEDFLAKRAAFIPRVGRSYSSSSFVRNRPRLRYKSRGTFIPRTGRRKRSISVDSNTEINDSSEDDSQNTQNTDDYMWENFEEKIAGFIPRIGRSYASSTFDRNGSRLRYKSRGTFIPRVGRRKRSISDNSNGETSDSFAEDRENTDRTADFMQEDLDEKRAAFIPRIGRSFASSTFRRSGPKLRYKSRGTFIPRIGRKKRSINENSSMQEETTPSEYKQDIPNTGDRSTILKELGQKRTIFIPRMGRVHFIPTIYRNGPRLKYRNRGTLIPRIG